ncbi:ABC transporter substrate-binding protein [Acidianus sp. RZ1]|uniref:ABC transporter substrate-binding protein n=1 Tax=Acidianus sp. RZ1 TaxID=1540082 RepID=UPI0014913D5E|nr:ABC transporter substrate-binding protein [Acidianus sp. RZ1]NON63572.1 ABC transporter substrate-binding protein [Acidianus sp. RZ1]
MIGKKYLGLFVLIVLGITITPSIFLASSSNGNVLTIGWPTSTPYQGLSTFNPNLFDGGLGGDFYGVVYAYSAVLNVSDNGVVPAIVTNWTFSPSNWEQVWQNQSVNVTMNLRNSGYANGVPVTAYDIAATCMVLDVFSAPPYPNYTIVNNHTLVETWPKDTLSPALMPFTLLTTVGMGSIAMIIPYHVWKPIINQIMGNWSALQANNITLRKHFISLIRSFKPDVPLSSYYNGPFYVSQITPSELVLAKNPYYYAAKQIPWNEVIIYQYSSQSSLIGALKSGQIDLVYYAVANLPPTVLSTLPSYYKVITMPEPGGHAIFFNFKNPWLAMLPVRQAIAYVLNRTAIAEAGGEPYYLPVHIPNGIPSNFSAFNEFRTPAVSNLNPYNTNLTKAKMLLESAGFTMKGGQWYTPNGTPFTLSIVTGSPLSVDDMNMLQVIDNELSSFGIPTTYTEISSLSEIHTMFEKGTGYDIWWNSWGGYYPGTMDWYLIADYYSTYPLNATQWNRLVPLPNGTVDNISKIYSETESPSNTSQLIGANDEMVYALNYYLPALPLVYETFRTVINTHAMSVPPSNSWIWDEIFTGVGGTALTQVGISNDYFVPITVTTTPPITPPVTTTVSHPSTISSAEIAAIVIVIIIIIIAAVFLLRRK